MPVNTDRSDEIYVGGTSVVAVPQFAVVSAADSGDNTLVAAVTGKQIKVHNIVLIVPSAVSIYFKSGSTAIGGNSSTPLAIGANGGFAPGEAKLGHFTTAAGEALVLNLSSAVSVGGWIVYTEV